MAGQTYNPIKLQAFRHYDGQESFIGVMRRAGLFMRSIAAVVLLTFTTLIVSPTVMAIENAPATPTVAPKSEEAKLSKALQSVQGKLDRMADKLANNQDVTTDLSELNVLKGEITILNDTVMADFAAIKSNIQSKNLPAVILERHNAAVADYQNQMGALLQNLTDIETTTDPEQRKTKVNNAKAQMEGKQLQRGHQPINPNDLGNKSQKSDPNNKAKESKEQFTQAGLFDTPYAKLVALGNFTFDKLAGASDPAYLAATPEITLSQSIQNQAAALNHDPVKIYHWVRNNIEWLPTWGAQQDADLTLSSKRGNSLDIASLTIALLRASGIPARYVHGTIEVPKAQFINWSGDFATVDAAQEFASVGGIPTTAVTSGGQITKMRLEHIWVEAAIDYQPSRGAKNYAADTWVQLDPSYKQYTYQQGLDAVAISGINPQQLAQDFTNSGTVNASEGWVTGFDATILQNAQTQAQTKLQEHITNNMTAPTVGDVIGGRKTIVQEFPVLPSALPNKVITQGATYGELPNKLRYQMSFAFGKDILGDLIAPITKPWAALNNHKITLSFKPATADDEAALLSLLSGGEITDLSQLPSTIPAYLIKVIPEIRLDGQIIKTGSPMNLGYDLDFTFQVKTPLETQAAYVYKVPAGSYLSIATLGQSVSAEKLTTLQTHLNDTKTKLESNDQAQIASLTREELLGDMFHAGTLGYFAQYNALSHIAAISQRNSHTLAIGYGSYGYEPNVNYLFGIPMSIEAGGAAMNIRIAKFIGTHSNDPVQKKNLNMQVGLLSSALEHAVPEQMFTTDPNSPADAVSAVKALQKAAQQGQRIYHITPANKATALPNIHHDKDTMAEINSALAVGKEVITHTSAISVPGWSGAGYIIMDPVTGDGSYKIGGGANGGWMILATALLLSTVIVISAISGLWLVSVFAALAYYDFLNRVNNISKGDLSEEQMFKELNQAAFIAVTAVMADIALSKLGRIGDIVAFFIGGLIWSFEKTWYNE